MQEVKGGWSSFPQAHKKRLYQGIGGYVLLCAGILSWLAFKSGDTIEKWRALSPVATTTVKNIYLTPQLTDKATAPDIPENVLPVIADGRTYVTIIISNLGLSAVTTERAINDLPPAITLAFSPYADHLKTWLDKAAAAKHESLILLPMESSTYPAEDPGPRALSARQSDADNAENLHWVLAQGTGTVGVLNLMGARLLSDKKRLSPVLDALRKNQSMFIETPGMTQSQAPVLAKERDLPYLAADMQIDATATETAINEKLLDLEKIARERGYAIGIANTYPLTFNILKSWASRLDSRGITLAPLTSTWKNKPQHAAPPL